MDRNISIKQGDIFWTNSNELQMLIPGKRPVLIISNNFFNDRFSYVHCIPLTTAKNDKNPYGIYIDDYNSTLPTKSYLIVNMATPIEKVYLTNKICTLDNDIMNDVYTKWLSIISIGDSNMFSLHKEITYEIGSEFEAEEELEYEFKEITGADPCKCIKGSIEEYIGAFLNNNGGKIIYGIRNDRTVVGVKVGYQKRDDIRNSFYGKISNISPSVNPMPFGVRFISLTENGTIIKDLYIIEFYIPKGPDSKTLYFTSNDTMYVKLSGRIQKLNGAQIQEIIKNRIIEGI